MRVPVDMLVGEENEGWRLITTQLNHERVMLGPAGRLAGLHDLVRDWAGRTRRRALLDEPDVRRALGAGDRGFRVNELLNWQVAGAARPAASAVADASATQGVRLRARCRTLGLALEEVVAPLRRPGRPGDRAS